MDIVFPRSNTALYISSINTHNIDALFQPAVCTGYGKDILGIVALYTYREPLMRTAIAEIKWHRNHAIAKLFASKIVAYVRNLSCTVDIITWIPASRHRMRTFGYCQNRFIALYIEHHIRALPEINRPQCISLLTWKYKKEHQKSLHRKERLHARSQLAISPATDHQDILNKTILLIDDVTTTGHTLSHGRAVLFEAGAYFVHTLALGH